MHTAIQLLAPLYMLLLALRVIEECGEEDY